MRILLLLCGFVLAFTMPALAQTGALVSIDVQIYNPGVSTVTGNPVQTNTFTVASATCNQAPTTVTATTRVFNPTKVWWDDPANVGKMCFADRGTFLTALPVVPGDYLATLTVTDDRNLTSARSAASNPFGRVLSPVALTGLRLTP